MYRLRIELQLRRELYACLQCFDNRNVVFLKCLHTPFKIPEICELG